MNHTGHRIITPKGVAVWSLLLVLAIMMVRFSWVGFLISDDFSYIGAAQGWLRDGAYVGGNHWEVRHPLVLPLAMSVGLFGAGEMSTIGVSTIYCTMLAVMMAMWLRYRLSMISVPLAICLLIFTPLMLESATILNVDIVEGFWCLLSAILFIGAGEGRAPRWPALVGAGIAAGLAFLSRETAIGLLLGYGLFFARGRYMPRRSFIGITIGFVGIVGLDSLYYAAMTGNPLHRYDVLMTAHNVPDAPVGNWITVKYLEPVGALFFNNEFGLLYFVAAGSAIGLLRLPKGERAHFRPLFILGVLAAGHFMTMAYGLGLRSLPRYYCFLTIIGVLFAAAGISVLWNRRRQRYWAACLLGIFVVSSLLLVDISNKQPILPERVLAETIEASPGKLVASSERTCRRASALLAMRAWPAAPVASNVCADPGAASIFVQKGLVPPQSFVGAEWKEVMRVNPAPTWLGRLWSATGFDRIYILPQRLVSANEPVIVWQKDDMEAR